MWKHSGGGAVPCSLPPFLLRVRAEMGRMLDCRMTNGARKGNGSHDWHQGEHREVGAQWPVIVDESVSEGDELDLDLGGDEVAQTAG